MPQSMEVTLHVVCTDCHAILQQGSPNAPVSHGYCETCFKIRLAEVDLLFIKVVT